MSWVRLGRFWGYGDREPQLVILMDSIVMARGQGGRADATPIIQWMVSKSVCRTVVVAYPGARVLRGDYMEMARASAILGAATTLVAAVRSPRTASRTQLLCVSVTI